MAHPFELRGKRVLVVGLARTGLATAQFCVTRGARVTTSDARSESEIGEAAKLLRAAGVHLELGGHNEKTFLDQDLIVASPGVPADAPLLQAARGKGVTIWSEIELADRYLKGRMIGITGSNGKTTTTSLIAHILKTAGVPTILAGNIGTPLISQVEQTNDKTITVVELSSFQLDLIDTFRADISVFLNLTPDHLDRHHTLEAYGAAKARTADFVIKHINPNPLRRFVDQPPLKLVPQVVAVDNVILNQHILLRLFDAIEDRFEGGLAIHKQLGIIASRDRAGQVAGLPARHHPVSPHCGQTRTWREGSC